MKHNGHRRLIGLPPIRPGTVALMLWSGGEVVEHIRVTEAELCATAHRWIADLSGDDRRTSAPRLAGVIRAPLAGRITIRGMPAAEATPAADAKTTEIDQPAQNNLELLDAADGLARTNAERADCVRARS